MFDVLATTYNAAKDQLAQAQCRDISEDQAIFGAMQRLRAQFPPGQEQSWHHVEIVIFNETAK